MDGDSENRTWVDMPSMGFNKNWICVHAKRFTLVDNEFEQSNFYLFSKESLYAGGDSF